MCHNDFELHTVQVFTCAGESIIDASCLFPSTGRYALPSGGVYEHGNGILLELNGHRPTTMHLIQSHFTNQRARDSRARAKSRSLCGLLKRLVQQVVHQVLGNLVENQPQQLLHMLNHL